MESCVVWGNMSADRTDEQYPTINYCNDCYNALSEQDENGESPIVHTVEFDICHGDTCASCGIDYDDEVLNNE